MVSMTRLVSCGSRTSMTDARLVCRIVVAAREERVADKDHVCNGDAEYLAQLSDAIGLVYARPGDIDRRRTA